MASPAFAWTFAIPKAIFSLMSLSLSLVILLFFDPFASLASSLQAPVRHTDFIPNHRLSRSRSRLLSSRISSLLFLSSDSCLILMSSWSSECERLPCLLVDASEGDPPIDDSISFFGCTGTASTCHDDSSTIQ